MPQPKKICLVGESLANGGAEKAMALLSQFFHAKGIEVQNVIVLDEITYDYSGGLLNLGKLKDASNGPLNKLKRFMALRSFLKQQRFDYIIDFRVRVSFLQEYFISRMLYDSPTVYTVHSAMTDLYFPKRKSLGRWVYKKAFALAAVSNKIADIIRNDYRLQNVTTINNPIDIAAIGTLADAFVPAEEKYILAAGRMSDTVKQFDQLIAAYAASVLPSRGIQLVLLGDGKNRPLLTQQAHALGLSDKVIFKGLVENPYPYMKNALFFVLSSRREGLPTVILESLACGKPVVSFDCVSGPAEMIAHEQNGLLVNDQNFNALTESMNRMVSHADLYAACCQGAKPSVQAFSLENIGRQWLELLKINVS